MSLSSGQLDAFVALSRHQSFSRAAEALHITQSALSQRIMKLEEELALTLFIRESHQVRLTPPGERLLRYCQLKDSLEEESLSDMKATGKKVLTGNLRIAGYSSVVRSVVVPALSSFLNTHADI